MEQLLPAAPDVPVQVAHLAGTGPGYEDPPADSVMAVLAEAVQKRDPRTRRLSFDVTTVVDRNISAANAGWWRNGFVRWASTEYCMARMRLGDNLRPREGWAAFRRLPLTDREFERIARNVAP